MFKTSEILTSVLILSILMFLFIFYKDKILENKYLIKISELFILSKNTEIQSPKLFNSTKESSDNYFNANKESSDNLFATEYEVSEAADEAISDALKNLE